MRGDLERLTADLPASEVTRSAAPERARERGMGDVKRSGAWVVPAHSEFRSWTGSIKLDLRQATISSREIVIDAFTPFGNIDLLVPEGVQVEVRADKRLTFFNGDDFWQDIHEPQWKVRHVPYRCPYASAHRTRVCPRLERARAGFQRPCRHDGRHPPACGIPAWRAGRIRH
jgi:hypothetical protein